MANRTYVIVALIICLMVFAGACKKDGAEISDEQKAEKSRQQGKTDTLYGGLIDFIRKQKLVNYPSATIGTAFDSYSYVSNKEWKESSLKSGKVTVDFTGWFEPAILSDSDIKGGVTGSGIDVTFVVETNGSFYVFMVSKIESRSDGKVYRSQSGDIAGILDKIYRNKKIVF